jgi:type VI secretion system protein ImpC
MARTRGVESGGQVEGLPVHTFLTDEGGVAMKCPTEVAIPDRREFELSKLGFLPLNHCKNRDFAAFMGTQSAQKPKQYMSADANANAELSAKFTFILCVDRFAHYLKVMGGALLRSSASPEACQRRLGDWLSDYTLAEDRFAQVLNDYDEWAGDRSLDEKVFRRPVTRASIEVRALPEQPGAYELTVYLTPVLQLEWNTGLRLVTRIQG